MATKAIFRYDGTLDKLVGDQVMAFFGAPVHREDHSQRALATALEILREVMTGAEKDLRAAPASAQAKPSSAMLAEPT